MTPHTQKLCALNVIEALLPIASKYPTGAFSSGNGGINIYAKNVNSVVRLSLYNHNNKKTVEFHNTTWKLTFYNVLNYCVASDDFFEEPK